MEFQHKKNITKTKMGKTNGQVRLLKLELRVQNSKRDSMEVNSLDQKYEISLLGSLVLLKKFKQNHMMYSGMI